MPDLQWYPVILYLTNNVEDNVVFPTEKVFKSHAFSVVPKARKSKSSSKTINEKNQFSKPKTWISHSYLIIKSCESDMPVNHTI